MKQLSFLSLEALKLGLNSHLSANGKKTLLKPLMSLSNSVTLQTHGHLMSKEKITGNSKDQIGDTWSPATCWCSAHERIHAL